MEMNKAFYLAKEARCPQWCIIDMEEERKKGITLGRVATRIADILRGKNRPYYTPHTDCGDYVVVINAEKILLSGNKLSDKLYVTYSGWQSGRKQTTAKDLLAKHPTEPLRLAVLRMLPKNKLSKQVIDKLKIYAGPEHPHQAQDPKAI